MSMRYALPALPSLTDYWGAGVVAPFQPAAPAVVVPETDNRSALPQIDNPDSRNGVKFVVVLTLVVMAGVMLAHWAEGEGF